MTYEAMQALARGDPGLRQAQGKRADSVREIAKLGQTDARRVVRHLKRCRDALDKRIALRACPPDRRRQLLLAKMDRGHVAKLRYRHEQGTAYVAGLPLHPIAWRRAVDGLPHAAKGSASRDFLQEFGPRFYLIEVIVEVDMTELMSECRPQPILAR